MALRHRSGEPARATDALLTLSEVVSCEAFDLNSCDLVLWPTTASARAGAQLLVMSSRRTTRGAARLPRTRVPMEG